VISAAFTAMVGPAEQFGQIGYNDVEPGGLFVVPGIGALRRDAGNYQHSRTFEIANGGKWDVKTARDSVEFVHTLAEPSINVGYVYTKTIRLMSGQPRMVLSHVMKNTGTKPIVTTVYNHNFTTIGMEPTGPDVVITVPWQMTRSAGRRGGAAGPGAARAGGPGAPAAGAPAVAAPAAATPTAPAPPAGRGRGGPPVDPYAVLAAGETMGTQCGNPVMQTLASPQGNRLVYSKVLQGSECYQASFTGFSADVKDHEIRIENTKLGAGVLIKGDRPMTRFGYWSIRTVLAPEPYIELNIPPGQEFTWSYTYDYYTTR
jgi:hypothetical protein